MEIGQPLQLDNLLNSIEERNNFVISEIQKDKENFDRKINKIINFINFKGKIDKIEAGYTLMFNKDELKKIKKLTEGTREEINFKALKKFEGNEEKSISFLFDSSSDI